VKLKLPVRRMKTQTRPLSSMRDPSKGSVSHVVITPAKNSRGGLGLITHVHRNRPAAQEAAMAAGGPYQPHPEPEQQIHEDPQDAMDHAANVLGVPQEPDNDVDDMPAPIAPRKGKAA
jgi:hypothetical protein